MRMCPWLRLTVALIRLTISEWWLTRKRTYTPMLAHPFAIAHAYLYIAWHKLFPFRGCRTCWRCKLARKLKADVNVQHIVYA